MCQLGRRRTYPPDQEVTTDQQRQVFIDQRCRGSINLETNPQHSAEHLQPGTAASEPYCGSSSPSLKRTHSDDADHLADRENGGASGHGESADSCHKAWTDGFQARSSQERVRNCQRVSQGTKDHIVHSVFDAVLAADDATVVTGQEGKQWRKGGKLK